MLNSVSSILQGFAFQHHSTSNEPIKLFPTCAALKGSWTQVEPLLLYEVDKLSATRTRYSTVPVTLCMQADTPRSGEPETTQNGRSLEALPAAAPC